MKPLRLLLISSFLVLSFSTPSVADFHLPATKNPGEILRLPVSAFYSLASEVRAIYRTMFAHNKKIDYPAGATVVLLSGRAGKSFMYDCGCTGLFSFLFPREVYVVVTTRGGTANTVAHELTHLLQHQDGRLFNPFREEEARIVADKAIFMLE